MRATVTGWRLSDKANPVGLASKRRNKRLRATALLIPEQMLRLPAIIQGMEQLGPPRICFETGYGPKGPLRNAQLWRRIMHKKLGISVLAATFLAATFIAFSPGFAAAQNAGVTVGRGTPPNPSTTGASSRSPTANTKGANQKRFCPPGQAKKPGKGSAFNC